MSRVSSSLHNIKVKKYVKLALVVVALLLGGAGVSHADTDVTSSMSISSAGIIQTSLCTWVAGNTEINAYLGIYPDTSHLIGAGGVAPCANYDNFSMEGYATTFG